MLYYHSFIIKSRFTGYIVQMLNKNTLGVKIVRGQSEAVLQTGTVPFNYV